jgi:hypothetical protein
MELIKEYLGTNGVATLHKTPFVYCVECTDEITATDIDGRMCEPWHKYGISTKYEIKVTFYVTGKPFWNCDFVEFPEALDVYNDFVETVK